MAIKTYNAQWVRFASPLSGMSSCVVKANEVEVLRVAPTIGRAFVRRVISNEIVEEDSRYERAQYLAGEWEGLFLDHMCPHCHQYFVTSQGLGNHITQVHGKKEEDASKTQARPSTEGRTAQAPRATAQGSAQAPRATAKEPGGKAS